MPRSLIQDLALGALAGAAGFAMTSWLAGGPAVTQATDGAMRLREAFKRPTHVPYPEGRTPTAAMAALGEKLFNDTRLSSNGRVSCATCHDIKLGLADGTAISTAGVSGKRLARHTPTLWNIAWAPALMWDGRAEGLEKQAGLPMSHPDEMGSGPEAGARALAEDPATRQQFAAAFPEAPDVNADNLVAALAAYQRTLVSPPTRFDKWVAGDEAALTEEERLGLSVFAGKAGCTNCHSGFAFTDHAFHDIGLASPDLGRGPVAKIPAANHAFKTPTLRELTWTAPYMHDGSLATLEDVVRHYESGGVARPTRSKDMPARLTLTDDERAGLVAFLEALSSDAPPRPSTETWVLRSAPREVAPVAIGQTTISQRDKVFAPSSIKVRRGDRITIVNDDTRTHNIRIVAPGLDFNSGAQEPGESVVLPLDRNGLFEAHCSIHPTMRLRIEVE